MEDRDDRQLLEQFIASGSHEAFGVLVRRYLNLVYAAAARQCRGHSHLADDVAQAVFIVLFRKAAAIRNPSLLPAWLIVTTRYTASNAISMETRRRHHERKVASMADACESQANASAIDDDDAIALTLDEALSRLAEKDRTAVTIRYLQDRSLREVGAALGVSDEAAQKRVMRAIEKLRALFSRAGVSMTSAAVAGRLTEQSSWQSPALLSAAVVLSTVTSANTATAASAATAAASGGVGAKAIADATVAAMSAAAKMKLAGALAASVVLLVSVSAVIAAVALQLRNNNAVASPTSPVPTLADGDLAPSPLVTAAVASRLEDATRSKVLTFPNAVIAPIGATNLANYVYVEDSPPKRLPEREPAVVIASRIAEPGLMPGMRGWYVSALAWRGKRLEVSAYLKTQDVGRSAGINVLVWGPDNRLLASDMDAAPLRIAGTRGWSRMASVLDIPIEAQRIEFGVGLWGPGTLWSDAFTMAVVPETVALTSDEQWHVSSETTSTYQLINDPAEPRDGHATARMESTNSQVSSRDSAQLVRVERALDPFRGQRVRLSAMMRVEDLRSGAGLFASAGHFGDGRRFVQNETKRDLSARGTQAWRQYTVTLDVPPDADMLKYGLRMEGAGKVWIDDVKLEVIP